MQIKAGQALSILDIPQTEILSSWRPFLMENSYEKNNRRKLTQVAHISRLIRLV